MDELYTKYSASSSLEGYIYQCRLALLETLKRLKTNPAVTVSVETLDDVVFEKNGTPEEIIQVKHHINTQANLTDASTDLWKTIRIWCDLYQQGIISNGTIFCIMTTGKASEESAAYFLKDETRNVLEAEKILLNTARTSTNKDNKSAYDIFKSLSSESRYEILDAAYIFDQCPLNKDIGDLLKKEIWSVCQRSKIDQFLTYLEGWWLNRILKSFNSDTFMPIIGEELDSQLDELREQFKANSLPIHADLQSIDVDCDLFKDYVFVHQLKIIGLKSKRISIAVNNYYRAFEQRSRWMREDLILVGDIENYEKRLVEEWDAYFETMREDLGDNAAETEKVNAARSLYEWVEKEASIPIRGCQELFITRGSYHILSDSKRVGWHPEFLARLESILELPGATK